MSNQRIDLSKLGKREWMPLSFNDGNLKNVACFFVKHQWDSERTINGTYAEYQIRGCLRCHRIEVYLGYEGSIRPSRYHSHRYHQPHAGALQSLSLSDLIQFDS